MTNPNHTDTSRSGDLVERLREQYGNLRSGISQHPLEAADRIEALEMQLESANEALREQLDIRETLEAENERLRAVLKVTHNLAVAYAVGTGTLFDEAMAEARAALGEKQ